MSTTPTEPQAVTAPLGGQPQDVPQEAAPATGDQPAELPAEVLRQKLTEANQDAASWRVKAQDAIKKLANAKTPEEVAEITSDMQKQIDTLNSQIAARNIADEVGIPASLAKYLVGTEDEMRAAANEFKALAAPTVAPKRVVTEVQGGLSPVTETINTASELAQEMTRMSRSRVRR